MCYTKQERQRVLLTKCSNGQNRLILVPGRYLLIWVFLTTLQMSAVTAGQQGMFFDLSICDTYVLDLAITAVKTCTFVLSKSGRAIAISCTKYNDICLHLFYALEKIDYILSKHVKRFPKQTRSSVGILNLQRADVINNAYFHFFNFFYFIKS